MCHQPPADIAVTWLKAHLIDEHDDDVLLREEGVKSKDPRRGVKPPAHEGKALPAHAGVQNVSIQLRVNELLSDVTYNTKSGTQTVDSIIASSSYLFYCHCIFVCMRLFADLSGVILDSWVV